jgi:basic membrane protein A
MTTLAKRCATLVARRGGVRGARAAVGLAAALLLSAAGPVLAQGAAPQRAGAAEPAVVYEAVQYDDSFNVAANEGIERYKQAFGAARQGFGPASIERMARAGHDPVIAIGFALAAEVERVAALFPAVRFTIIDAVVDRPNVQSIVFKEHEGAYLVGLLAALSSKSGTVGFIGGMDIPVIRNFRCGYEHGARSAGRPVTVLASTVGTTPAAFNDPEQGAQLAEQQFERGADVVFAAAGGSGLGAYKAAKQRGKLAIGVDRNQNFLYPGTMLTSMIKRIDTAVYLAAVEGRDRRNGGARPARLSLGLKEQGVSWALDRHNRALVTPAMQTRIEAAARDVIEGRVQVERERPAGGCGV